jgi:hypothetical protein
LTAQGLDLAVKELGFTPGKALSALGLAVQVVQVDVNVLESGMEVDGLEETLSGGVVMLQGCGAK